MELVAEDGGLAVVYDKGNKGLQWWSARSGAVRWFGWHNRAGEKRRKRQKGGRAVAMAEQQRWRLVVDGWRTVDEQVRGAGDGGRPLGVRARVG